MQASNSDESPFRTEIDEENGNVRATPWYEIVGPYEEDEMLERLTFSRIGLFAARAVDFDDYLTHLLEYAKQHRRDKEARLLKRLQESYRDLWCGIRPTRRKQSNGG